MTKKELFTALDKYQPIDPWVEISCSASIVLLSRCPMDRMSKASKAALRSMVCERCLDIRRDG